MGIPRKLPKTEASAGFGEERPNSNPKPADGSVFRPFRGIERRVKLETHENHPGLRWFHITWSTLNAWLPGDERGFRSKHHKLHSSGDHRNPPPKDEHAGLRRYWQQRAGKKVVIPPDLRAVIGKVVLGRLLDMGYRVLVISVGGLHVHALVQLPNLRAVINREIGRCKRASSAAVTKRLPGRLWQRKPGIKAVNDRGHQVNTYKYIFKHREDGAWVWCHREAVPEECVPKKRRGE